MEASVTVGVVAIAVILGGLGVGVFVWDRWRRRTQRAIGRDLETRLTAQLGPETGSHLEHPPTVRRIAVLDTDADDETATEQPVYVPVVRIDLETTDAPGMKLILEYVAAVLEAIHPALESQDGRVSHYDIECTFGPDGLFVEGECRRVSVTPALADRLLEDERYGAFELWRDVKRGDRDAETATILWGPCQSYSRFRAE